MKKEETARSLTEDFVSDTSMHGFNRLVRKPGFIRKTLWTIAILAGASVSVWGIVQIGISYSSREVATVVSLEYDFKLDFPAVTICNLNPARKSAVQAFAKESSELEGFLAKSEGATKDSSTHDGATKDSPTQDSKTKDSPTQSSGTKDSSTQSSETKDSPTQGSGTKDSPTQGSSGAKDSPTQGSGTKDSPTQSSGTKDSPTQGSSGTKDSPTQSSGTKDSPTQGSGTKDSPTQSSGTKDSPTQSSGTKDSPTQSSGTKDSPTEGDTAKGDPAQGGAAMSGAADGDDKSKVHKQTTDFVNVMSSFTLEERKSVGHQLKDMLLECYFLTKNCDISNFTQFYSYLHGNCYTFSPYNQEAGSVTRPGPYYGLSLGLTVEEAEYMPKLAKSVGFKVVVHGSTIMPFPEDEGFSISPGFSTLVGVSKVVMDRAPPPYSKCRDERDDKHDSLFSNQLDNLQYSDKACDKSCLQKRIVEECGCCDKRYPCEVADLQLIMPQIKSYVPYCGNAQGPSSDQCSYDVVKDFEGNGFECRRFCKPNCYEETHQLEISSSLYPVSDSTTELADTLIQDAIDKGLTLDITLDSPESSKEMYLRRNVLYLEVFYKQLSYEKVVTRPAYTWNSLLSDVGGQAGLWLGFSLLTLGEILELLYDIIVHLLAKIHNRRTDVKPFH